MKKFILSLISILSIISIAFGMAGCIKEESQPKGENLSLPQQSAEEELKQEPNEDGIIVTEKEPYFDGYIAEHNLCLRTISYEEFENYLNNEYSHNCNENFYIWTPNDAGIVWYGDKYNSEGYNYIFGYHSFMVFAHEDEKTGEYKDTVMWQMFNVYPEELNANNSTPREYLKDQYAGLVLNTIPVKDCKGEIEVRYGGIDNYFGNMFANIYCGDTCIGTCHFYLYGEEVTNDWLTEYLKTHLTLWRAN